MAEEKKTADPAEEAKRRKRDRAAVEQNLLEPSDYGYFVVYAKEEGGRRFERSVRVGTLKEARQTARRLSGRIERRVKKSGCRKLADYYGLSLPERPVPTQVELIQIGSFIFQKEIGAAYAGVKVMSANQLSLIKAEYTVAVESPGGKRHAGVGACAQSEGRSFSHPDHDIPATAWTRAYNRAVMDSIGWGATSADEAEGTGAAAGATATASGAAAAEEMRAAAPARAGVEAAAAKPQTAPVAAGVAVPVPIQRSQMDTVATLARRIGMSEQKLDEAAVARHKKPVRELSRKEAVEFINHLLSIKNSMPAA